MKLKQMTCKNCNAPLKLDGDKMVCAYCGGVFDIEKDQDDIEYDMVTHAEEYILKALTDKKAAMEEKFRRDEIERVRKEEAAIAYRKEQRAIARREKRLKDLRQFIIMLILLGIGIVGLKYARDKVQAKQQVDQEKNMATGHERTYRVTPKQIAANEGFLDEAVELALKNDKDIFSIGIYDENGVEWTLDGEPEVVEKYLGTHEEGNGIYVMFKNNLVSADGGTTAVYSFTAVENFTADKGGTLTYNVKSRPTVETIAAESYDENWNGYLYAEQAYNDVIKGMIYDETMNYIVFEL